MVNINIIDVLNRVGDTIKSQRNVDIASALGVNQTVSSNWKNQDRNTIPWEILFDFCQKRNILLDWLLTGKEPPPRELPILNIQETPRFKTFHPDFSANRYIPVPLLHDSVAAGSPSEIDETDIDGWALIYADKKWMPKDPENYTCCRIQGASMYPILSEGDIVAIERSQLNLRALDKKMVAFRKNGGVTIKWLKVLEDGLVVGVPENKDNFDSVISLQRDEIETGIVGRVAWWWAKR